jgi:hypothetical protein
MIKYIIFLFGFLGLIVQITEGQSEPIPCDKFVSITDTTLPQLSFTSYYLPYGGVFTPKGTVRILIIFARFTNDFNQACGTWPSSSEVPEFIFTLNGTCPDFVFKNENQFDYYAGTDNRSMSRFFYDFSMGQFKLLGNVLCDNDGEPYCVRIDPTSNNPDFPQNSIGWGDLNLRVLTKMKQEFPDFDWSPYDLHANWPRYQSDASQTGPDMKPDYIFIIYRYSAGWTVQPVNGMNNWGGSHGALSSLSGLSSMNYDGYTFDGAGCTFCSGGHALRNYVILMQHEIAHSLYSSPHYMAANWLAGNRWQFPASGWGIMQNPDRTANISANGWERWLLGWHDLTTSSSNINTDIKSAVDLTNNGIYSLRDFITYGDVIRIKIPNTTDNYLWIENRQRISAFDHKNWAGAAPSADGEEIPEIDAGLYIYVENILGDRNTTVGWSSMNQVNGIKILNAQGNYDYWHSPTAPEANPYYYYGNTLFTFKRLNDNPISGLNPYFRIPDDYPDDPQVPGSNGSITYDGDVNVGNYEAHRIIRESNDNYTIMTYANLGGVNDEARNLLNRRSDAFQVNDEIGLSGIIPALNYPLYDEANSRIANYILNSLYLKVLSFNSTTKEMQIQIKFNDYEVRNNKRWCGFIELRDNTANSNADLILAVDRQIDIDKNGNANRHTVHPSFNDFINPSIFYQKINSYFLMNELSRINLKNYSSYLLESNSKLEIKDEAVLTVKSGSTFLLSSGSNLLISGSGRIEIESGAYICIDPDANITLQDPLSVINLRDGYNAGVNPGITDLSGYSCSANPAGIGTDGYGDIHANYNQNIYVQNVTISTDHYYSGNFISIGNAVDPDPLHTQGPVVIQSGTEVIVDAKSDILIDRGFEAALGCAFEIR